MTKKNSHPGIFLLPNLLTTASLFAAFYSIVSSFKSHYEAAVIAIFVGMITDNLDGRIARLTNTQTDFGAEYDSMSDMVTFGIAPALLLYSWGLHQLGKIGWLISFIYTAAVALRLARFNTQLGIADKRYFQGLACPAGAGVVASFVWLCHQNNWNNFAMILLMALITLFAAVLMVSNIRYYSFKDHHFKGKPSFLSILLTVILFVAVASYPSLVVFLAVMLYAFSGPCQTLMLLSRMRKERRQASGLRRKKRKK